MKTGKARVVIFDVQCPHCENGLLQNPHEGFSFHFSAREAASPTAECVNSMCRKSLGCQSQPLPQAAFTLIQEVSHENRQSESLYL